MFKRCKRCGKEDINHAKGLCFNCYRKYAWDRKLITCKRCGREKPNHAKGFCAGCYQFTFHLDQNKAWNYQKRHNLDAKTYKEITSKCAICGFDKVIDLHHLDENSKNNIKENLIGLCPNHHKMLHNFEFRQEIFNQLQEKGFKVPNDIKMNFKLC